MNLRSDQDPPLRRALALILAILCLAILGGCSSEKPRQISIARPNPIAPISSVASNTPDNPIASAAEAFAKGQEAEKENKWQEAIEYYKQSAEQGNAKAQTRLGGIFLSPPDSVKQDLQESYNWYFRAAKQSDAEGLWRIGKFYESGIVVQKDLTSAVAWWQMSSDAGYLPALMSLGNAYFSGSGVAKDEAKAVVLWQTAADKGDAEAQMKLGGAYALGIGVKKDVPLAFSWFMKAAMQHDAAAELFIGKMYLEGRGTETNIASAIHWLELAMNNPTSKDIVSDDSVSNDARLQLISIYASGNGVAEDPAKVFRLATDAADHGSVAGKLDVASAYLFGRGTNQNLLIAIRLYSEVIASHPDDKYAINSQSVAAIAATSNGIELVTEKKYQEAFLLLKAAAEIDTSSTDSITQFAIGQARYFIGKMYSNGTAGIVDHAQAAAWWKRAADISFVSALEPLGEAYFYGKGVAQDTHEAIKYLLLAAAQGDAAAIKFLEKEVDVGWHFVGNANKEATFARSSRLFSDHGLAWLWIKTRPMADSAQSTAPSTYTQIYEGFNCGNRSFTVKSYTKYRNDGGIADTIELAESDLEWSPVAPDSIGEVTLDYVCSLADAATPSGGKLTKKSPKQEAPEVVSLGTGWSVAGGFVVTNHHVVAGHRKVTMVRQDGVKLSGVVVLDDATNDLVLIRPSDTSKLPPAIPVAAHPAPAGTRVFTIGYPHPDLMGSEAKITDGLISAMTGYENDPRTYQISVPLQAGNSGGPLLNMNGEVVGITASKISAASVFEWTGDLPQNVNYAIKSAYLSVLLSSVTSAQDVPILPSASGSIADLTARIKKSVLLVIAE